MKILFTFLLIPAFVGVYSQPRVVTFQEAARQGIPFQHLDSLYKSAVHTDTTKAVFRSAAAQQQLQQAYISMLRDLGVYLAKNKFVWAKDTRCFNRIYFTPDGKVDYFLYNFLTPPGETPVPEDVQQRFAKLVTEFTTDYRFGLQAGERFAQCSPVTYKNAVATGN